jgi:hypothetical protein
MKKLLASVASLGALVALSLPASASGAFTSTTPLHNAPFSATIPIACAGPFTGTTKFTATVNGVEHLTVNGTGDWFTATAAGEGTVVVSDVAASPFQGHVEDWFGAEDNLQNNVFHATFNFHGASVANPSQTLAMHAAFDVTVNANGTPTASHFTVSCS